LEVAIGSGPAGGGDGNAVKPAEDLVDLGTLATLTVDGDDVPLRSPNYTVVDLTLPEWGMRSFPNYTEAQAYLDSGQCRNAEILERFFFVLVRN
jgi:hypothetical protein